MPTPSPDTLLHHLLDRAKALGATDADARVVFSTSISVDVRLGKLEGLEQSESAGLALRCFFGQRHASVSGTELSAGALDQLAERCVAMARLAPEDRWAHLTPPEELARDWPDLGADGAPVPLTELERVAMATEDAARAVQGVTNSSGAGASYSATRYVVGASNGFFGGRETSGAGFSVSVVAGENGQMERDYASCGVRDWADIRDPATVGREAGERAVARLGARKIDTQRAHVVFERRLAASLIGPLIDAIRGSSIARGVSFMKGKAGEQVLPRGLSLIDDPLRVRGLASRAFDGEGRPVARTAIVEDGILSGWLHNNASARQLGERPNGFAGFGFGDPPGIGTSNLYLTPGGLSPEALLKEAGTGLLVTDMFGPSLNPNTGDYSVGVSGFWFEGGERAYPVNEVTVAGSLPDMLARIVPASDLVFEYGTNVPTLLIPDVSLAGR